MSDMTLEELLSEQDKLATEMRAINIRSWGLKPKIHDDWCRRARMVADGLRDLLAAWSCDTPVEEAEEIPTKKVPPPPPKRAVGAA